MYIDILQILAFLKLILFLLGIGALCYIILILKEALRLIKKVNGASQQFEDFSEELASSIVGLFKGLYGFIKTKHSQESVCRAEDDKKEKAA